MSDANGRKHAKMTVMLTAKGRIALAADALAAARKVRSEERRRRLCEQAIDHLSYVSGAPILNSGSDGARPDRNSHELREVFWLDDFVRLLLSGGSAEIWKAVKILDQFVWSEWHPRMDTPENGPRMMIVLINTDLADNAVEPIHLLLNWKLRKGS